MKTLKQQSEANQQAQSAKDQAQGNAQAPAQAGTPPPPENNNDDNQSKSDQSAKDAKKLDNKGADKYAQEKGYKDAHDLKKDYVKGQKDKIQSHYNIYRNSKTGDAYLQHKNSKLVIPLE